MSVNNNNHPNSSLNTFSLVMGTKGRSNEILRFIQSAIPQAPFISEIIIVDQNEDERVNRILSSITTSIKVIHLKSMPGLSRSRNVGLNHITGDIVAFPDDDCWYSQYFLSEILNYFNTTPSLDGLCGIPISEDGKQNYGNWYKQPKKVSPFNVWGCGCSFTIFLKKNVVQTIGNFDEKIGVGAGTIWGAGEESDYLIRAVKNGFFIKFDPSIRILHPNTQGSFTKKMIVRSKEYGYGIGYVLRKNKIPLWNVCWILVRPLGGILISIAKGNFAKAKMHKALFIGRFYGYLFYNEESKYLLTTL